MKTYDEVKSIVKKFAKEYAPAIAAAGNNLASGIGNDEKTGEPIIVAYLTNKKLKTTLPDSYEGVKVKVSVIGVVRAL